MSIIVERVEPRLVPARVVGRFQRVDTADWMRMDNNAKAKVGKARFLEMPTTLDATSDRVREWLAQNGLETRRREWVAVVVAPDLPPRYVNLAYTARCVDAFMSGPDGVLQGCELKVSGSDGVCGLTVNEERLLRAALIGIFLVNPVRGLIGQMDTDALLSVPRRVDGIPVGQATVEWQGVDGT
jgi:hypothetical protein